MNGKKANDDKTKEHTTQINLTESDESDDENHEESVGAVDTNLETKISNINISEVTGQEDVGEADSKLSYITSNNSPGSRQHEYQAARPKDCRSRIPTSHHQENSGKTRHVTGQEVVGEADRNLSYITSNSSPASRQHEYQAARPKDCRSRIPTSHHQDNRGKTRHVTGKEAVGVADRNLSDITSNSSQGYRYHGFSAARTKSRIPKAHRQENQSKPRHRNFNGLQAVTGLEDVGEADRNLLDITSNSSQGKINHGLPLLHPRINRLNQLPNQGKMREETPKGIIENILESDNMELLKLKQAEIKKGSETIEKLGEEVEFQRILLMGNNNGKGNANPEKQQEENNINPQENYSSGFYDGASLMLRWLGSQENLRGNASLMEMLKNYPRQNYEEVQRSQEEIHGATGGVDEDISDHNRATLNDDFLKQTLNSAGLFATNNDNRTNVIRTSTSNMAGSLGAKDDHQQIVSLSAKRLREGQSQHGDYIQEPDIQLISNQNHGSLLGFQNDERRRFQLPPAADVEIQTFMVNLREQYSTERTKIGHGKDSEALNNLRETKITKLRWCLKNRPSITEDDREYIIILFEQLLFDDDNDMKK